MLPTLRYVTLGWCGFAVRRANRPRQAQWEGYRTAAQGTGYAPAGSAAKVPYITCSHTDSAGVFCVLRMFVDEVLGRSFRVMFREIVRCRWNSLLPLSRCGVAAVLSTNCWTRRWVSAGPETSDMYWTCWPYSTKSFACTHIYSEWYADVVE